MLSVSEKRDFLDAFDTALRAFNDTDDEIVVVDTKISGHSVNALILVRNTGLTANIVKTIYYLMDKFDRSRKRVKR